MIFDESSSITFLCISVGLVRLVGNQFWTLKIVYKTSPKTYSCGFPYTCFLPYHARLRLFKFLRLFVIFRLKDNTDLRIPYLGQSNHYLMRYEVFTFLTDIYLRVILGFHKQLSQGWTKNFVSNKLRSAFQYKFLFVI